MRIDSKLAIILSKFFLNAANAFFAGTFIVPSFGFIATEEQLFIVLTRGIMAVILALWLSWKFSKISEEIKI